ncbi:uncharacterized protein K452DRAFT_163066 [Aplosporella prunicola CBS 121167]|uniref:Uncharacterized protein n=1 Tax=Aplosporella prunicola CBS 121167 TaxID=1176127 RepID=A0A6A6BLV9_9PEZI|nr:uncharacterized protein K452DRAFT_163066 [Aplosporella prunicola CBS 121167]KAF2143827.1 hypothetical protein K452DRAFT_163066 [Aplosporella prunicola CBS 121167]
MDGEGRQAWQDKTGQSKAKQSRAAHQHHHHLYLLLPPSLPFPSLPFPPLPSAYYPSFVPIPWRACGAMIGLVTIEIYTPGGGRAETRVLVCYIGLVLLTYIYAYILIYIYRRWVLACLLAWYSNVASFYCLFFFFCLCLSFVAAAGGQRQYRA